MGGDKALKEQGRGVISPRSGSEKGENLIAAESGGGLSQAHKAAISLFGLKNPAVRFLPGGKVNESFLVETGSGRFVLQRINDFFQGPVPYFPGVRPTDLIRPVDTAVGDNWLTVGRFVTERSGLPDPPMPPIFPDLEGQYLASFPDQTAEVGGCWRLTGFMDGLPAPKSPAGAREAARLLGFFHRHLNLPYPVELMPLPKGEFTNQHLTRVWELESILDDYRRHPQLDDIRELVGRATLAAAGLMARPDFITLFDLHDVVIHGDPKADNFLFSPDGRAVALLDWDSVGLGHVLVDVAELLRSWGSFSRGGELETDSLTAAVEGYAEAGLELSLDEVEMLPAVLRAIALNLCRRYLIDALAQVYFKWNEAAYPSLFEQNRARAEAMLEVAERLMDIEVSLGRLLVSAYASVSKME